MGPCKSADETEMDHFSRLIFLTNSWHIQWVCGHYRCIGKPCSSSQSEVHEMLHAYDFKWTKGEIDIQNLTLNWYFILTFPQHWWKPKLFFHL